MFKRGTYLLALGLCAGGLAHIFIGCAANTKDDNGSSNGGTDNGTSDSFSTTTDSNGSARTTFNVPSGTTKFQILADAAGFDVRFDGLSDSRDIDYLSPGGKRLTLSQDFSTDQAVADAPSRNLDPALDSSQDFRVDLSVGSGSNANSVPNIPVNIQVIAKQDPDLSSGVLHVNIYYVGPVGQDPDNKAAVHSATAIFQQIYRSNGNISLSVTERDIDGPATIPSPFSGADFYLNASQLSGSTPALNIFIAGDIDGFQGEAYGIAGNIPGPVIPSSRSGVAVSMITAAGIDGAFSAEDLRILGETMAHEGGHFLGLFHPIDFTDINQSTSTVADSDPLTDTPTCSTQAQCSTISGLAQNVMYPTPVSDGRGGFLAQNQLTSQQSSVLNRSLAVD